MLYIYAWVCDYLYMTTRNLFTSSCICILHTTKVCVSKSYTVLWYEVVMWSDHKLASSARVWIVGD